MNAFIFALNVHTGVPIDFITYIDVSFESLHTYRCASVKTQKKYVIVLQCLCVHEFVSQALLGCSPCLGMFP